MKVTVVLWIPNPFLLQVTKKIKLFLSDIAKLVKFGLKSALKKISAKELSEGKLCCFRKKLSSCFCLRKLPWFYEVNKISSFWRCKLFYAASFFSTNVVPKLFTYSQNYERRAGKRFFCQFTTLLIIFGEFVHVMK